MIPNRANEENVTRWGFLRLTPRKRPRTPNTGQFFVFLIDSSHYFSLKETVVEVPECSCTRKQFTGSRVTDPGKVDTRCPTLTNRMRGSEQKVLSYCMYGALENYIGVSSLLLLLVWYAKY
jgi:hypothetical protein